ncbi:cyclin family [Cryptosporidium ryanae]|uniref:cyclin family n=1 Tax=Cryptosporidium ryanae TaxID=515981 RepID=UPI00351A33AB|nr:cyclin family [Cryptosporidium ryanae]
MVLNIMNRLSKSLSLSNTSFVVDKSIEQLCPESRNIRKLRLWNSVSNNKGSSAKLSKFQKNVNSEKTSELKSNDGQPLLCSSNDNISKLSTKSSMKYSDSFEELSVEIKAQSNQGFEQTNKKGIIKEISKEGEIELLNESNNGQIYSFNYKSYPLSNVQIMNWINKNWSEVEFDEIDTKNSIMVEIDELKYKGTKNINKRVITPFHSLTAPKITIGEYFITRIVKFMSITPVDFCVIVILVRRAIKNSNGILKTTTLTAHRLVLAASLLTYKLMYDVQYGLKFWAHIGGVPQWEMVVLEHHLLKILNWNLSISFKEFIEVYYEILSTKSTSKKVFLNEAKNYIQLKGRTEKLSNTPIKKKNKNNITLLQINVSDNNSDRKKC